MLKNILLKLIDNSMNQDDFIGSLRNAVADYMLIVVTFFSTFAVLASIYRTFAMGWQPIFYLHVILFIMLMVVTIYRKYIPSVYKSRLMIVIFYLAGTAGFIQFGLLSGGVVLYTITVVLSLVLLEFKYFTYMSVLSVLSILLLGVFYPEAHIITGLDANEYASSSTAWMLVAITFVALLITVLVVIGTIFYSLVAVVNKLKIQIEHTEKVAKDKALFFANMSHELRTPLNGIIGFSRILTKKQTNQENIELSRQINNSSKSLLHLINDILDLSKIEDSKFTIDPYEFNAYEEMCDMTYQFPGLTAKKTLIYKNEVSKNLNNIFFGDWTRINQIILNLISNSVKFTPKEGTIGFSCDYQDGNVIIKISDNGIGMSQEVQDKIFMPFIQADGSTSRKYGGTGLGLNITQNLVEMMKGKIELASQVDFGTTFTVTIPLVKLSSHLETVVESNNEEKKPLNAHILVVEDNKTNQMLISMLLEEFGVTLDMANDGEEAVKTYDPNTHDLILMDENMPIMSGIEAMKKIREIHKDNCTPIIALTANAMAGDKDKFIELGMDDYLSKPIDEENLYATMRKWLKKS